MDIEQLTMILDLIREAGAGTKDLVILYFVYLFLVKFLLPIGIVSVISFLVYKLIRFIVEVHSLGAAVITTFGMVPPLTRSERKQILKGISRIHE